jgi:hypothetical protein
LSVQNAGKAFFLPQNAAHHGIWQIGFELGLFFSAPPPYYIP